MTSGLAFAWELPPASGAAAAAGDAQTADSDLKLIFPPSPRFFFFNYFFFKNLEEKGAGGGGGEAWQLICITDQALFEQTKHP